MKQSERIDQLEEQLSETNERLTQTLKQLLRLANDVTEQNTEPGRWKPDDYESYWHVDCNGRPYENPWCGDCGDDFLYLQGNCFQTEEEAEHHLQCLQAIGRVRSYIEENYWFKPDWDDKDQEKFNIFYNHDSDYFHHNENSFCEEMYLLPILPSEEAAEDVIENYEGDLRIIFNINN